MKDKTFKIKKNSWHTWLMKYTWGFDYADFNWACAYVWLNIFNFFVFPITVIIKEIFIRCIGKPIIAFFDWYREYTIRKKEQAYEKLYRNLKTRRGNIDMTPFLKMSNLRVHDFINWLWYRNADLAAHLQEEWKKVSAEIRLEIREIKEKKKRTRQQTIQAITEVVKPIVIGLLIVITAGAAFGLGYVIYLFIHWLNSLHGGDWSRFFWILGRFGIAVAGVLIFIALMFLIAEGVKGAAKVGVVRSAVGSFLMGIAWPFVLIFKFFRFLIGMIRDACPRIEWY